MALSQADFDPTIDEVKKHRDASGDGHYDSSRLLRCARLISAIEKGEMPEDVRIILKNMMRYF